jgi:hypothetical protein
VSLDGRLAVLLPPDLLVHAQSRSLLATHPDLSFRVYLGRADAEGLLPAVGATKEALIKRGFWVVEERHFEQAVRVALRRGKEGVGAGAESRVIWIVDLGGSLLHCEGLAVGEASPRLGEPLRALCRGATLAPEPRAEP